jgi:tetratricopeptide (TPR) repeat protein
MTLLSKLLVSSRRLARDEGQLAPALDIAHPESPLQPVDVDLLAQIDAHNASGLCGTALGLVDRALAKAPARPELLFARASTLFAWGRIGEALEAYVALARLVGLHPALCLQLGWAYFATGHLREAEGAMRKAVAADAENLEARCGLATVLFRQRNYHEALQIAQTTLARWPDDYQSLIRSGLCRFEDGDAIGAEAEFRRAIRADETQTPAWMGLGISLRVQRRHAEALEVLQSALRLDEQNGGTAEAFVALAKQHLMLGQLEAALDLCERNLPWRPSIDGHRVYGEALLTAGRLTEGWGHYEFRWLEEPMVSLRLPPKRPPWDGQDLRGKTLLLRLEQGLGDKIQFVRYAPFIKALGATVLMGRFSGIATGFPGVDRLLGDEAVPEVDYYVHQLSLPRIFGTEVASIPADVPYLEPDAAKARRWRDRLGVRTRVRIGIAWAGDPNHLRDRDRSTPLSVWTPLFQGPAVHFFSLQKGPAATELGGLPPELAIVNLGPELDDLSDTAAVISHLDLVICVDTAVAHLAGALGKPVWLLVQKDADWRWLHDREDSPWYPTLRLFRQSRHGDWPEVVFRVKAALEELIQSDAREQGQCAPKRHTSGNLSPMPVLRESKVTNPAIPGLSAVAETPVGILQYFPGQDPAGKSIGWYGEFLHPQLELLAAITRPGASVVEVAAGVGAHALALAAAVGSEGHLILFESRPAMRLVLLRNLAANHVLGVSVLERTLGRAGQDVAGLPPWGDAGATPGSSLQFRPPVDTLDEHKLQRLDLLKTNAGADVLQILDGGSDTLWRLRPRLFLAADDEPHLARLVGGVKQLGYRCWRHETALFNPGNFNCREADIFSGRTALALLAFPEETEVDIDLSESVEL